MKQNKKFLKLYWRTFPELENILEGIIDEYSYCPLVRELSESLTLNTGFDFTKKIHNIANFIDSVYSFNRDPLGREYVQSPGRLSRIVLGGGQITGDCDDITVFFLTLFKSIGINGYMVFTSPKIKPPFTHVFPVAVGNNGDLFQIDLVHKGATHPGGEVTARAI